MPNAIATNRKSYTYLEETKILNWMTDLAKERGGQDIATIVREATAAYYVEYHQKPAAPTIFVKRQKEKGLERKSTEQKLRSGTLSRAKAQAQNAPITQPVKAVDLWTALRRHTRTSVPITP